jgi:NAD+ diphosphatase
MSLPDHLRDAPPFTGMSLDRATIQRADPDQVAQFLDDPATRAVAASEDGVLITNGEDPSLLRSRLDGEPAAVARDADHEPMLLGLEDGAPLFAVDLGALSEAARDELAEQGRLVSLREAGSALSRSEGGLAAYLAALLNWHRTHSCCANCGARTLVREAGYSRRCPRCGATHFPRTDPVVIMTVEHQGRLLLGRRAGWPGRRYSVLAGFVSPGESAEEAVIREVEEESGIVARDPSFVTSQPWPFPRSLMLGFEAQSDGGEPKARDGELDDVGWFTYDEVREAIGGGNPELKLPPSVSLARFLIDRWLALHRP